MKSPWKTVYGFRRRLSGRMGDYGFNPATMIGTLIGVLIAAIIGFALFSTLLSSVASVNAVSKYASGSPIPTILNLAPLLFALGIVIATVAIVFVALRLGIPGGMGRE